MVKCEVCDREFKTKAGLTIHSKTCKEEVVEEVKVEPKKVEPKEKKLSADVEKQIKKLIDAKNSCYDAKTKHDFEMEIKRLSEG